MIKKTAHSLVQLLGGLGTGLAIIVALGAWRLSTGPVSLVFLTPHIESAFNRAHSNFRIELDEAILKWDGWGQTPDIRVLNVQVADSLGRIIASVPEVSLSLSIRALAGGRVALKRIELFKPSMRLLRLQDGRLQIALGKGSGALGEPAPHFIDQLAAVLASSGPMSYLSQVTIIDADLTIKDLMLETTWRAPQTKINLRRDLEGVRGEASLKLDIKGHKADVEIIGDFLSKKQRLDASVSFDGIRPALFARLNPALKGLSAFSLPLRGTLAVSLATGNKIKALSFDLNGEKGYLALPAPLSQKLPVERIALKGRLDDADGKFIIDNLNLEFGEKGTFHLPGKVGHDMPIRSLQAKGLYEVDLGRLDLSALEMDLAGPTATATAVIEGLPGAPTLTADAVLRNMPMDALSSYWPKDWRAGVRKWSIQHLSGGQVLQTRAHAEFAVAPDGKIEIVALSGDVDFKGVSVDYLPPMPKVSQLNGQVSFDMTRFDVNVTHGKVNDLTVREGTVYLTDLDKHDKFADIRLAIDGPFKSAVSLVNNKPLGFATKVGIAPQKTGGMSSTRLKLHFILEKGLSLDQVGVSAELDLENAFIGDVFFGRDVTKGNLRVNIDKQGMDILGDIELAGIPTTISWRRNFGKKAPVVNLVNMASRIEDFRRIRNLGFGIDLFAGNIPSGAANTHLIYTEFQGGRGALRASADLEELSISLPYIGWSKASGEGGSADVSLSTYKGLITGIDYFRVAIRDLDVTGSARYAKSGTGLERVDFFRIAYGRTDIKGTLVPNQSGSWAASVHGVSFDMSHIFDGLLHSPETDFNTLKKGGEFNFSLSMDLDSVWLGETQRVRHVTGAMTYGDDSWQTMRIEGLSGADAPFYIHILPDKSSTRVLKIRSADAGSMLKAFGLYDNMIDGSLEIDGTFDDTAPGKPLTGTAVVEQYRVIEAPILAHLIGVITITGIIDSLEGDGLGFLRLEAPFTMYQGVIDIEDAKSSGVSLGFTASGRIYTHAEVVELQGTIVPVYGLNAALGNIPLFGKLITGGEEGGGIFAARYKITGKMEDPDISVNPLSVLAPGFLRNLFSIFEEENTQFRGGPRDGQAMSESGATKNEAIPNKPKIGPSRTKVGDL